MSQILFPLIVLLAALTQKPSSESIETTDWIPAPVWAHVPRELLEPTAVPRLIEELREFRSVAAAFSAELRDPEHVFRAQLDRGVLAMRAAAAGKVIECRIPLIEIVAACEHPGTEPYVLDALAALRTMGEPEAFFMDLLARAPASYHRAASAMMVMGWTPSDELVESARAATRASPGIQGSFRPRAAMTHSFAKLVIANTMRRKVAEMGRVGNQTAADKLLLQVFWGLYSSSPEVATLSLGDYPHGSVQNCARILLGQRAAEDPAGLRASIDAMTLYDFLLTHDDGFGHLDPDKRLATFREQVLSMLPESVREAKPAEISED